MAKLELLPQLDARFEQRVQSLANEAAALSKSYTELTKAILGFAKALNELWERGKMLDRDAEYGAHRRHLAETIAETIGTDSKVIRSRWLLIGQQASSLTPYRAYLPPVRDSLYEVALAAKENLPVDQWVNDGVLTPESSVREIRGLRDQKKRKSTKRTKRRLPKGHPATVTLCFESYEEAIRILTPILLSDENCKVVSEKAFVNGLTELDEGDYEKARQKLG